jgi:hypothetical protein
MIKYRQYGQMRRAVHLEMVLLINRMNGSRNMSRHLGKQPKKQQRTGIITASKDG